MTSEQEQITRILSNTSATSNSVTNFDEVNILTNTEFVPIELSSTNEYEILKQLSKNYNVPEILIKSLFDLNKKIKMNDATTNNNSNQNDKEFILNLENEIIEFIVKPNVDSWKLTPLNSYYRLLTHKLAEYYNLGHILSNDGFSMVLFKINTSLVNADDETKKNAKFDQSGNIKPLDFRSLKFDPLEKLNRIKLSNLYDYYNNCFDTDLNSINDGLQSLNLSSENTDLNQSLDVNIKNFRIMKRKGESKSNDTINNNELKSKDGSDNITEVNSDSLSKEERYKLVKERIEKELETNGNGDLAVHADEDHGDGDADEDVETEVNTESGNDTPSPITHIKNFNNIAETFRDPKPVNIKQFINQNNNHRNNYKKGNKFNNNRQPYNGNYRYGNQNNQFGYYAPPPNQMYAYGYVIPPPGTPPTGSPNSQNIPIFQPNSNPNTPPYYYVPMIPPVPSNGHAENKTGSFKSQSERDETNGKDAEKKTNGTEDDKGDDYMLQQFPQQSIPIPQFQYYYPQQTNAQQFPPRNYYGPNNSSFVPMMYYNHSSINNNNHAKSFKNKIHAQQSGNDPIMYNGNRNYGTTYRKYNGSSDFRGAYDKNNKFNNNDGEGE